MNRLSPVVFLIVLALLVAGCGSVPIVGNETSTPAQTPTNRPEETVSATYEWVQLLARDAIQPIYDPQFVPADQAMYDDDELVMGIALDGEAKAYPVGLLNRREMVNDKLAGTPILVTW